MAGPIRRRAVDRSNKTDGSWKAARPFTPGLTRWRLPGRRRNDSGDRQTPASGLLRGLGDGAGEDRMADGGLPTVLALAKAGVRSET